MTHLTEKDPTAVAQFVAALTEGDRISVHWFDAAFPGGRVWVGTVLALSSDKKIARVKYDAAETALPFPPTDVKIHDFKRIEVMGYGDAVMVAEGTLGVGGTLRLDPWDVTTHGMYLNVTGTMSADQKAQNLVNYDHFLRVQFGLGPSDSRTSPDHDSNVKYRLNDCVITLVAWGGQAQTMGAKWRADPGFLHIGDCVMASAASLYVDMKKKSVVALAQSLDKPGKGLRHRIGESVKLALGKKPGEGITEKQ